MPMTALDDLVVNISDLEQRGLRPAACDPSSRPWAPRQEAGCRKIMERAVDGHARGAKGVCQLRLGRHAIALGPCTAVDLGEHEPLDPLIERLLAVRPARQFEGALAAGGSLSGFQHALDNPIALVQILLP